MSSELVKLKISKKKLQGRIKKNYKSRKKLQAEKNYKPKKL